MPKDPWERQFPARHPAFGVRGIGSSAQQRQDVEGRRVIRHWAWPTAIGSMNGEAPDEDGG